MNQEQIARVCHQVNKAYCEALGDSSQPDWEKAPEWQRASARMGVDLHTMGDFGPEASHISWASQKLDEGWKFGPLKDPEKKEHPCLVPFAELPCEQQAKDFIFRAVVHALRGDLIAQNVGPAVMAQLDTAPVSDQAIEQEIQAKGLTAPRVTPADIEANIIAEHCFTAWEGATVRYWSNAPASATDEELEAHADGEPRSDGPLGLLTFCVLILRNGFTVTGESACASPENFDAEIGRKVARANAVQKIWPLMGYALKQSLSDQA